MVLLAFAHLTSSDQTTLHAPQSVHSLPTCQISPPESSPVSRYVHLGKRSSLSIGQHQYPALRGGLRLQHHAETLISTSHLQHPHYPLPSSLSPSIHQHHLSNPLFTHPRALGNRSEHYGNRTRARACPRACGPRPACRARSGRPGPRRPPSSRRKVDRGSPLRRARWSGSRCAPATACACITVRAAHRPIAGARGRGSRRMSCACTI